MIYSPFQKWRVSSASTIPLFVVGYTKARSKPSSYLMPTNDKAIESNRQPSSACEERRHPSHLKNGLYRASDRTERGSDPGRWQQTSPVSLESLPAAPRSPLRI